MAAQPQIGTTKIGFAPPKIGFAPIINPIFSTTIGFAPPRKLSATHPQPKSTFVHCRWRETGEGKPETFNFLGFTHMCGQTRSTGRFTVRRKTIGKRVRAKLQEIRQQMRQRMRCGSGDGEVAAVGRARLLQLSRGSRPRETASGVPRCSHPGPGGRR